MKAIMFLWEPALAKEWAQKGASALENLCRQGWQTELWLSRPDENAEEWAGKLPYDTVVLIEGLEDPYLYPQQYKEEIIHQMEQRKADLMLFPGTDKGRELAAGCAVITDGEFASSVLDMNLQEGGIGFHRNVYNCNLVGAFQSGTFPLFATMDANAFVQSEAEGTPHIIRLQTEVEAVPSFAEYTTKILPQTDLLTDAKRILISGRGASSAPVLAKLQEVALRLGGKTGATRPVAQEGKVPTSQMVGMSGSVLRPELCIVCGASGAAPFMAGIHNSGIIVAVNTDEEAAIFRTCDYGILEEAEAFLDAFLQVITEEGAHG